ncbi:phospholipase D-like domain-containing protein [Halobacteriovorax sp. DPLXC-1]|uniref:phospholipase D-like domain-containing protein n=1 Tax=Halobacteriovorax sp. DPLXC-1 TaxID=3110771 RepID=UPI002FF114D7
MKFVFGHPMLTVKVSIELQSYEKLSATERLIFSFVERVNYTKSQLVEVLPFNNDFASYLVDEYLFNNYIDYDGKILVPTEYAKDALSHDRMLCARYIDVEVVFDPATGKIYSPKSLSRKNRYESLARPVNYYDESVVNDRLNIVHLNDFFNQCEDIPYEKQNEMIVDFEIIEKPTYVTYPIKFNLDYKEGVKYHYQFSNSQTDLTMELSEIYMNESKLVEAFHLDNELKQSLFSALNLRDSFSHSVVVKNAIDNSYKEIENLVADKEELYFDTILNQEHPRCLREMLNNAKDEIFIASGWIRTGALNQIDRLLQKKLNEGVKVNLLYGYKKNDNASNPHAIGHIEMLKGQYPNLKTYEVHHEFHMKCILVDDKTVVIGSFNWLSNTGSTSVEASLLIREKKIVESIRQKLFKSCIEMSKNKSAA